MLRVLGDEAGGISVLSLQMLLLSLIMGGLAVDVGNAFTTRTQLQITADSAAHAALWSREWNSADTAKAKAITVAQNMMPVSRYGTVLTSDDIVFGNWDSDTRTFTPDSGSKDAVFVSTRRYQARNNGLSTWFLRLVGKDEFDVAAGAIFETYLPGCAREGFMAEGRVDTQSNNTYKAGFCVHSQDHVEVNSNSVFETGSVVSMPDKNDLVKPASGFDSNIGLKAALRDGSYAIRVLDRLGKISQGLTNPFDTQYGIAAPGSPYARGYITSSSVVSKSINKNTVLVQADLAANSVNSYTCNTANKKITLSGEIAYVAIITNCQVVLANGATLHDAVILTTNTDKNNAVSDSNGLTLGLDDDCATGGDVQIVSYGKIKFNSNVNFYGAQMISLADIELTANGNGFDGISLVAGGEISVTSNGEYGFCGGGGMENNYGADYFRMVG